MLVSTEILHQALNNYELRTKLIRDLLDTPRSDPLHGYKMVLAFLLGSNISKEKIRVNEVPFYLKYQYFFIELYYSLMMLDKAISYAKNPTTRKILEDCRETLFSICIQDYLLLEKAPFVFFAKLIKQFANLPEDNSQIKKIKKYCYENLSMTLDCLPDKTDDYFYDTVNYNEPPQKELTAYNDKIYHLNVKANKMVANYCRKRHPFFARHTSACMTMENHKILLTANDGTILEGLEVDPPDGEKDVVVLTILATFQPEHQVVTKQLEQLADFFGTTTVFPSHRNFSLRAARFAKSPLELAEDIVRFADYYHKTGKRIVLYGMCGGGVQMILAAVQLQQMKIPFKLIIDRAFQKYTDCLDMKTVLRMHKHADDVSKLGICIVALTHAVTWPVITFSNLNINFAKLLATIPENDVLLLQAKDKTNKHNVDLFVHPKNDMRYYFRKRRHQHKINLQKLYKLSNEIANSVSADLRDIFLKLATFFKGCLTLLEDEKITIPPAAHGDSYNNIHDNELPTLITQHNDIPLSQFVRGFFKKEPAAIVDFTVLQNNLSLQIKSPLIEEFTKTIMGDLEFLNNMARRTTNYGMSDISEEINSLVTVLSKNRLVC